MRYFFGVPSFLRTYTFWTELVCSIFKSPLPFLTFMNYKGPYFVDGFLHNLCPCFKIAFAELRVISRTRNKFVEIVTVAKYCLNDVKNKEPKKQPFWIFPPVKLSNRRMSLNKEENSFYLIHNIVSLGKMVGKPFSWR